VWNFNCFYLGNKSTGCGKKPKNESGLTPINSCQEEEEEKEEKEG